MPPPRVTTNASGTAAFASTTMRRSSKLWIAVSLDANDRVARLDAASLGRTARDHLRDRSRCERPHADVAELLRPVERVLHLDDLGIHREIEQPAAAFDRQGERRAQMLKQGELQLLETFDVAAVELDQPVARLNAGDGSRAAVAHGADLHRRVALADDHEEDGEDHRREQQVREGPREYDGRALAHTLGMERIRRGRPVIRGARAGDVGVAVELHVAAERQGAQFPARPVPIVEAEQLRPEADREHLHANPVDPGHQVVAELVDEHDGRDHREEGPDIVQLVDDQVHGGQSNGYDHTGARGRAGPRSLYLVGRSGHYQ